MKFYKKAVRRTILISEDTDKEMARDARERYLSYSRNTERILREHYLNENEKIRNSTEQPGNRLPAKSPRAATKDAPTLEGEDVSSG